ncbi:hypothetical protein CURTO8I2_70349 [Curtobacterium sp. 8I-2]|nr:hypothetical protein CURTO8I2_70349 [Curtobacterium sp. 8I-2]
MDGGVRVSGRHGLVLIEIHLSYTNEIVRQCG